MHHFEAIDFPTTPEEQLSRAVASNPTILELRASSAITERRHVLSTPASDIDNNLIATTLSSRNCISVPPFVFLDDTLGSIHVFYHLGPGLAGHSGILHGGLTAVLLDECMGRASFSGLPNHIGVTASIEISYLAPVKIPSVILIKATTEKVDGRKAWIIASVESPDGLIVFAKARALFVEPRGAERMNQLM